MGNTTIAWTEKTWNPVSGCDKVSQGCKFCYAESIANRFAGGKAFPNGFAVTLHPERLLQPLKWRKPQMVFVNSMSDLFHEDIPTTYIRQVWDVMAQTPQHTYQILTKRPQRMRDFSMDSVVLPNVWLGVSIEDRKTMTRISSLIETDAVVRFISAEPLLDAWVEDLPGWVDARGPKAIQWVILGGESGPKARTCYLEWVRRGVTAIRTINAAPFVKQLGSVWARQNGATDPKGEDMAEWPEEFQIREYPTPRAVQEVVSGSTL